LNDPPLMLYVRGRLPSPGNKLITVAGAEQATNEGIALTTDLTKVLAAAGVQVLSSLRSGIDAAAHFGCRTAEGTSYALLDTGFDDDRWDELRPVAIDIVAEGGVISEFAPDHPAEEGEYKKTNRLLAAMPQAVVLTEFYSNSEKAMDLLRCCHQIGKLTFILVDPDTGAHSDEEALHQAVDWGAIPMVGRDKIDDIIKALV
jgi:DNA processing protein